MPIIDKYQKRILLYFFILILILSVIRIFVLSHETKYNSLNLKNINAIQKNVTNDNFSFIVMGNIKNSLPIFHKSNLEVLNSNNPSFIISLGNAVYDGGEFKYNLIHKNLERIGKPYILTFGKDEKSDGGDKRFYRHFGPYYFSFHVKDSYFIFLDTTGKTSEYLQKEWLEKELKKALKYKNRIVFMQKSPIIFKHIPDLFDEGYCFKDNDYREYLISIFQKYGVTAVFSGAAPIFAHNTLGNVNYFNTGCIGGALLLDNKNSFRHYLKISIDSKIKYKIVKLAKTKNSIFHKLANNISYYIDLFFYLSLINFILILSAIFIILNYLYRKLSKPVNYYRNFDNNSEKKISGKLTIIMFSNNYLPFIGGVPISIQRLAIGLRKLGHNVYIFAPEYKKNDYGGYKEESHIFRYKPLFYYHKANLTFPVPNIFSTKMRKTFLKIKPDIIHIHHPYWMGNIGLKWAKKDNIPTVFTYHTRLEQYAHNLPAFHKLFAGKIPHELIRNFANQCDAIIAPTTTAKEYLRNLGVGKIIKVIPTGIDFSNYNIQEKEIEVIAKKYDKSKKVILFSVSRLSKEKNMLFLLDGINYIAKHTEIPFQCLIAGNGPEKENLLLFIKNNGLEEKIILLGAIPPTEISKYFMLADIFIFASKSETQGMVLLEAMAGKTPVVAVRSSGIDDVIENGLNGFKTEENIEKWAEKVIYLMKNKKEMKQLSINAFHFSQNYSSELIAEKISRIYHKIIIE